VKNKHQQQVFVPPGNADQKKAVFRKMHLITVSRELPDMADRTGE
jgi:hypothetical protein